MSGVTYDTGMLIAAESNRRDAWLVHARVVGNGTVPVVPAVVLAQAWRGGPQPLLARLLRGCRIEAVAEDGARRAGRACARASTSDVVDAIVVVGATERDDIVVTSDPEDMLRIAAALGRTLAVHRI